MATFSIVLATYNEEKNLSECLESIKSLADEIIIVDGSSKDKTVDIARKFGAKVKITDNPQIFHINKQKAIDLATKEWILQLDADERVPETLVKEIKEKINNKPKENGFWIPRKNWFLGRFLLKGGQYPDYTLRLYRKGKGRLPQKDVHEQAVVEGETGYLKHPLVHIADPSFKRYLIRFNRYTSIISEQLKEAHIGLSPIDILRYLLFLPGWWFIKTYVRHKGFMDGWQGFVFSFFSALRYPVSYLKALSKYHYAVIGILILASLLRFYHFSTRWGLGGDDARDILIALEALRRHELPLFGSFSSAGPFVFGPLFYWIIMFSYIVLPFVLSAPWVITALVGIISIILIIYCAKLIGGETMALITGLFAATSPQLVIRSVVLGQHTYVFTFTVLCLLSFVLFIKQRKSIFAFIMGLSIGIALSMHYQSINLFIFFPVIFIIPKMTFWKKIRSFMMIIIGFIIPSLPLLYWDAGQGFANVRNVLDYLFIGQYRIYVPNSWTLFVFKFLGPYWSFVIGGNAAVSLILIFAICSYLVLSFILRKLSPDLTILGIFFFILLLVNRYYRGERSESYLLYLVPFIILFSSWIIYQLFDNLIIKRTIIRRIFFYIGVFSLIIIAAGNLLSINVNAYSYSNAVSYYKAASELISAKFPGKKFILYDDSEKTYATSTGLSVIMHAQGLTDKNGIPIGVSCGRRRCPPNRAVIGSLGGLKFYDLRYKKTYLNKEWVNRNSEGVYNESIIGVMNNKLKSSFSLKKYILERIKL